MMGVLHRGKSLEMKYKSIHFDFQANTKEADKDAC